MGFGFRCAMEAPCSVAAAIRGQVETRHCLLFTFLSASLWLAYLSRFWLFLSEFADGLQPGFCPTLSSSSRRGRSAAPSALEALRDGQEPCACTPETRVRRFVRTEQLPQNRPDAPVVRLQLGRPLSWKTPPPRPARARRARQHRQLPSGWLRDPSSGRRR